MQGTAAGPRQRAGASPSGQVLSLVFPFHFQTCSNTSFTHLTHFLRIVASFSVKKKSYFCALCRTTSPSHWMESVDLDKWWEARCVCFLLCALRRTLDSLQVNTWEECLNCATQHIVFCCVVAGIVELPLCFRRFSSTKVSRDPGNKCSGSEWAKELSLSTPTITKNYSATEHHKPHHTGAVHLGSKKETGNEWLNCVVALPWLDSSPATHCTCNPSSKYLMFLHSRLARSLNTHAHTLPENTQTRTNMDFFFLLCLLRPALRLGPASPLRPW